MERLSSNTYKYQERLPSPKAQQTLAQHVKEPRGEQPTKESEVTLGEGELPFYNVTIGSRRSPTF